MTVSVRTGHPTWSRRRAVSSLRVVQGSSVGEPEIIDPRPSGTKLVVTFLLLVAGLVIATSALMDSLHANSSLGLPRLEVPDLSGLDVEQAAAKLTATGFEYDTRFQSNEDRPKGVVVRQWPLARSKADQGDTITIVASDGPQGLTVPDVVGQQSADAQATLQGSGVPFEVVQTPDEVIRADEVVSTQPASGARVPQGGVVRLFVSTGPAPRTVPAVVDRPIEQVLVDIGRAGLQTGKQTRVMNSGKPPGTVLSSSPQADAKVPRDTPIALSVAADRPTTKVPLFVGIPQQTAARLADDAHVVLNVVTTGVVVGDPQDGRVLAQSVAPYSEVDEGTTVKLTIASSGVPPVDPGPPGSSNTSTPGGP
ncbi:MAG: PASTA domain-containing protein [Microthrixaceae bacterium]